MELILTGADAVRRGVWRQLTRTALGRVCATDRNARITALACVHVAVSATLALLAPMWLLLLGPLLLGVPHVMSDVRFFWSRQNVGWLRATLLLAPVALLIGYRVAEQLGVPRPLWTDVGFGCAAIVMGAITSRTSWPDRLARTLMAAGITVLALADTRTAALVFAHAHNVIAVIFFVLWARGAGLRMARLTVPVLFGAVCALLYSGWLEPWAVAVGAYDSQPAGLTIEAIAAGLAPGLASETAMRVVVVYAFAQAMHYVLWLRLTPAAVSTGPAAPSFRRTARLWRDDLGRPLWWLAIAATLALPIWAAATNPTAARDQYLSLAGFHGWLELAVLMHVGIAASSGAARGAAAAVGERNA